MAIEWGSWEGSSPTRIRVGIDTSWEAVSHSEGAATVTVKYYVDVEGQWSDTQTLNFTGALGGSMTFSNNQSNSQALRETKTKTYSYGSNEYGSSPGSWTFGVNLSGAWNGATPSKSVTTKIPARPIAAPNPPTNVNASYISDTSIKISWSNKDTAGEPWQEVQVDREVNNSGSWSRVANLSGGATSYTNSTSKDSEYQYRVRAQNSAGTSSFVNTDTIWTTPDAPSNATRTGPITGGDQVVSWTNNASTNDYATEVWSSTNGGSWVLRATVGTGVSSWTDVGTSAANAIKYKVRAKTELGSPVRYSSYSNETTETAGQTTPPLAPTNLSPNNLTLDPTLRQTFSWTFNLAQAGDAQTKFEVNHRLVGAAAWSTSGTVTSANRTWDLPANTYADGSTVEWRVRTYGADPNPSPWSTSATIQAAVAPVPADPVKVPVQMDLSTGQLEANTNAFEQRDYVMRVQSNLMGGGVRAVSSTYGITWSQRFIAISLGRSANTFPGGHHDILNPFGWTVNNKQIVVTSGISRATLTVTTSNVQVRPGEILTVSGVGAPYDGQHVCRSISSNQISYDLPNGTAAQAATASGGSVWATIRGHGFNPPQDFVPTSATVTLPAWGALYYELPFGWGGGSTVKKNGVVQATSKSLTSNVATIGLANGHWFSMSDRVLVQIGDPTFDGEKTITAVTPTSISFSQTATNVSTTTISSPTAIVKPLGRDTFFGNFHLVDYRGDFVVPSNWVMIAMRNVDSAAVEWGSGDVVDAGYDSDSPVFKQAIFTATQDVNASSGNKPAIRIGTPTSTHMRIDNNEIQAMSGDASVGGLTLNMNGGNVNIGASSSTQEIRGTVEFPHIPTTTAGANCNLNASLQQRMRLVTSLGKWKLEQEPISVEAARGLLRVIAKTWFDKFEAEENGGSTEGLRRIPGFVAEDMAAEAPLWATFNDDGEVTGVAYDRIAAGLAVLARDQESRITELESRLARLERLLVEREG